MPKLKPEDLVDAVHWWELAGHHDPAALVDAWRQAHLATQAVAELGKGWAEAKDDDSHSGMVWVPDHDRLPDQFFAGQLAEQDGDDGAAKAVRALLRPWDMRLFLIDGAGTPINSRDIAGVTMQDAVDWIRENATSALGHPRQDAQPAPDLPEHPVREGSAFEEPNQLAMAEVIRLYSNTDAMLARLAEVVGIDTETLIWPHHFDIASLYVHKRGDAGGMTKTIGFGLTPPDGSVSEGYWYVSPWSSESLRGPDSLPSLVNGEWLDRGSAPPMAFMRVSQASSTEDRAEQQQRLAAFVASAFSACQHLLDGN